jgi:hypothetical protein
VVERGYENQRLQSEAVAEFEYQPGVTRQIILQRRVRLLSAKG